MTVLVYSGTGFLLFFVLGLQTRPYPCKRNHAPLTHSMPEEQSLLTVYGHITSTFANLVTS